jgi:hypothetical protein
MALSDMLLGRRTSVAIEWTADKAMIAYGNRHVANDPSRYFRMSIAPFRDTKLTRYAGAA